MYHYLVLLCCIGYATSLPIAFTKGDHFDIARNGMRIDNNEYVTVSYETECAARCVQAGQTCITYSVSSRTAGDIECRMSWGYHEYMDFVTDATSQVFSKHIIECGHGDVFIPSPSPMGGNVVSVEFINESGRTITLHHSLQFSVDDHDQLTHGESATLSVQGGHVWFATDEAGMVIPMNGRCQVQMSGGVEQFVASLQ